MASQIENKAVIHCKYDEMIAVDKLARHPKQANKHPEEQIQRLAEILKYQGWRSPICVSTSSGYITRGHGRLDAAKLNGWDSVPVIFQDYTDEDQEVADLHADNGIGQWSELDLSLINLQIPDLDPEFNVDLLGLRDFVIEPADKFQGDEDDVPEPQKPIVKNGELYILGEHRLLCGDSTDATQVERLMNGQKADMVFTDPPYNHASENSLIAKNISGGTALLKNSEWDKNFEILPALNAFYPFLAADSSVYVFSSWLLAGQIWEWMSTRSNCNGYCVWTKTNPRPCITKRQWNWATELVCYMTKGKHVFNCPDDDRALNYWLFAKENHTNFHGHPTQKPVKLCEWPIEISSNPEQLILDTFLGSGSTLIACEKTNRKCRGAEIDPLYCDVIIQRWMKYTGKMAYLIGDANGELKSGPVSYAELISLRSKTHSEGSKNTAQRNAGLNAENTEEQLA